MTAIMCLLAAGAVMVFSASSARSVLSGQGDGTHYLVQYVLRGSIGVLALLVVARLDLSLVARLTGPFLGVCFVLLVLVKVPGIGVEVNGAQRWMGPGPLQFQPSELMKLALDPLRGQARSPSARSACSARRSSCRSSWSRAAPCCSCSRSPTSARRWSSPSSLGALMLAAGTPMRYLGDGRRRRPGRDGDVRDERRRTAATG